MPDIENMSDEDVLLLAKAKRKRQLQLAQAREQGKDIAAQTGAEIISGAMKAVDYPFGLMRTGLPAFADLVNMAAINPVREALGHWNFLGQPVPPLVTEQDVLAALRGNAPTYSEYLGRMGYGPGPSLSDVPGAGWMYSETGEGLPLKKGGLLDPTFRGTVGTMIESVVDPLHIGTAAKKGTGLLRQADVSHLKTVTHPATKPLARGGISELHARGMSEAALPMGGELGVVTSAPVGKGPLSKAAHKVGSMLYKGPLRKIDNAIAKYGKYDDALGWTGGIKPTGDSASTVLDRFDIYGTPAQINAKAAVVSKRLKKNVENLITTASETTKHLPAPTNMDLALRKAWEIIKREELRPTYDRLALEEAKRFVERYASYGHKPKLSHMERKKIGVTLDEGGWPVDKYGPEVEVVTQQFQQGPSIAQLHSYKQDIYKSMGESSFNNLKNSGLGDEIKKAVALGMKEEVERSVKNTGVEGATLLKEMNSDLGTLLTARKSLEREAAQFAQKPPVSKMDAMIASAMSLGAGPLRGAQYLATKKAVDIGTSPWAATTMGRGLQRMSTADPTGLAVGLRGWFPKMEQRMIMSPIKGLPEDLEDDRMRRGRGY